jgi:Uma2 family endonuclease
MSQAVRQLAQQAKLQVGGGVVLRLPDELTWGEDEFFEFCQANRDLRIERTANGEIIIVPPTGGETGNRNADLTAQLYTWAKQETHGAAFDSSSGFILPNLASRAPDASWVRRERLAQLTAGQKRKFLPLCPDFVVELMSPSDTLEAVQAKLEEYIANGAQLGWLIDPDERHVYVYRPGQLVEKLEAPERLAGDPQLPGFVLELAEIWEPSL